MAIEYLTVNREDRGLLLDEFLSLRFPRWSKGYLRGLIRRGLVSVDGKALLNPGARTRLDEVICVDFPEGERKPLSTQARMEIEVLYEDAAVWVVNKPAGIAVEPERWDRESVNLGAVALDVLEKRGGDPVPFRPRLVHRLDKGTSGVIIYARNLEAERDLRRQFEQGEIHKEYLALVDGEVGAEGGEVQLAIAPDPRRNGTMRAVRQGGRSALTLFSPVETYQGYSLVRCLPRTGRTHQIRVHMAASGHPLIVDPVYGRRSEFFLSEFKRDYKRARGRRERPLLARLSLHATSIEFLSPGHGKVRVDCQPPKDIRAVVKQLGRWRSR